MVTEGAPWVAQRVCPGFAGQRFVNEQIREIHQLADGAATVQLPVIDGRDPSGIVSTVLQPFQSLDEDRGRFVIAQYTDNSTHLTCPFAFWLCARAAP